MKNAPKGKESMNDFASKNQLVGISQPDFRTPSIMTSNTATPKEPESLLLGLDSIEDDTVQAKEYNDSIFTSVSNIYKKFKPRSGYVLIRVFRDSKFIVDESGLLKQKEGVLMSYETNGGQKAQFYYIYEFTNKAVIITSNEYAKDLVPGQRVQIKNLPAEKISKDKDVYLAYQYKHPDSNAQYETHKLGDEDYGYFLVPESLIIGWLD